MTLIYKKESNNGKIKYVDKNNKNVSNNNIINYIKSLVIPPAYKNVVIDISPNAKIVATGYDDKGRKQYLYSKKHIEEQSKSKFCNLIDYGNKIIKIDDIIKQNLNKSKFNIDKTISIILSIMFICNFRIGTEKCKLRYNSSGLTTLSWKDIKFTNKSIIIDFIGKKGVRNICEIKKNDKKNMNNNNINNLIKSLEKIDKYHKNRGSNKDELFFWILTEERPIKALEVNNFLKKFGSITSKDIRTWNANILFLQELDNHKLSDYDSENKRKKLVREIKKIVAEKLHHTPTVLGKSYLLKEMINDIIEKPNSFKMKIRGNKNKNNNKIINSNKMCKTNREFINYLSSYC